jgi:hypothetical protein
METGVVEERTGGSRRGFRGILGVRRGRERCSRPSADEGGGGEDEEGDEGIGNWTASPPRNALANETAMVVCVVRCRSDPESPEAGGS